tara:strand:- start:2098 stop:2871 length:774 start_codon:yes stop_codon:yes gene_type:complete
MSLLKRLFGTKPAPAPTDLGAPRPLQTTYVVGDIHGRADLLENLLVQIDADRRHDPHAVCICLGDFVDRGEQSGAVLELLRARQTATPATFVCLMGNHERMLLDFIDRTAERGQRWLRNGGLQTLASMGVSGITESAPPDRLMAARDQFLNLTEPAMFEWLRALPTQWDSGNLVVVHAALDPNAPPDGQSDRTRIWGHRDFLTLPRRDGLWVAHGHTIIDQPHFAASRIAVDTGAYYSGTLTAAKISPTGTVDFLQT